MKNMPEWKRKLTSRKLWMSIASFVAMMLIFFGSDENSANQVAAIVMAAATVIGYVFGEGLADYGNSGQLPSGGTQDDGIVAGEEEVDTEQ